MAWALVPLDAAAFKRRALVIANAQYEHTKQLSNPGNDATLIAGKLRQLGFQVLLHKDVDAKRIAAIVQEFSDSVDKDTDALIYYAGHGLQFRGENLLVGIDAWLNGEATIQFETFKLNTLLNLVQGRAGTTLLFWDACRNNPLADTLMRSLPPATRDAGATVRSGAASLPARRGDTLIVFSAEPGREALDGAGDYSPFAEALGRYIASPNLEIEQMLKRVTHEVWDRTRQFQRPERLSQLMRDFYFLRSETADAAYESELKTLREKLEQMQRQPAPPQRRFRIIGSDDPSFRKAPPVTARVTTRSAPGGAQTAAPKEAKTPAPDTTGSNPPADVVIAVDRKSSAIVRRLRVSPDGKLLAIGDDEGIVRIVRLETFEVARTITAHKGRVSDLDFSPDNRILLSAGRDGFVRYWDVEDGHQVRELSAPGAIPYSARMNSAFPEKWVIMGDRGGRLYAWDLPRNQIITNAKFHDGPVYSVGYQPGGKGAFFSGGADGLLKVRMPMGERYIVHAHTGNMYQASYSNTGSLLYTVGNDRKVKIWETAKLKQDHAKTTLDGHLKYVLAADMTLDERLLATGGGDKALNIWDVASGNLAAHLEGHTSDVEAIAFAPNGKFVVSASEDKSVRIWSVENHEELVRLFFQRNGEKYAGVTLDNNTFGDHDSGLVSIYVDGRQVSGADADRFVRYIGRGIAILDGAN